MQSSLGTSSGLRVESFFPASENETDTDSDSGAFSNNRSRRSTNEEGNRLSTPELIRHAFNLAVIKVRLTITNELNQSFKLMTMISKAIILSGGRLIKFH